MRFHYSSIDQFENVLSPTVQEIQNLKSFQKGAAAIHSSKEVRLNRALEEMEKVKTQLNKIQQMNKVGESTCEYKTVLMGL